MPRNVIKVQIAKNIDYIFAVCYLQKVRYPKSIQNLIDDLSQLPTVGPRTAERFVIHLLKQPQENLEKLAKHIYDLKNNIKVCSYCLALSETNPCAICADKERDRSLLCIVSGFSEMLAIEASKAYNGLYLIIGKNIDFNDNSDDKNISLKKLKERIKENKIKEVILALSPNMEGETVAMYLARFLKQYDLRITKLARGLPMGSDIEYADEITLNNALINRNKIQ
ncbi:recombination protein RecR [Candidatus Falkowbacteria bacterium]|nr:recombination protein RecR [Candidatus Falkowbacteria bacterium]